MLPRSDLVEGMAITAAAACLAHCLALPLILAGLPALAVSLPIPATFHVIALFAAVPTTLVALWLGYRRHVIGGPLIAGVLGLVLLALGAITYGETPAELPITVAGSLLIAVAHLANWQLRRRAEAGGSAAGARV